jgi:hypothetical protein
LYANVLPEWLFLKCGSCGGVQQDAFEVLLLKRKQKNLNEPQLSFDSSDHQEEGVVIQAHTRAKRGVISDRH